MSEGKWTEALLSRTHKPPLQHLPPFDIQHITLCFRGFRVVLGQPKVKGL